MEIELQAWYGSLLVEDRSKLGGDMRGSEISREKRPLCVVF